MPIFFWRTDRNKGIHSLTNAMPDPICCFLKDILNNCKGKFNYDYTRDELSPLFSFLEAMTLSNY